MNGHPTKKIGDFCRTGSGGTPSRGEFQRYYEDGDIPWVKSGELREGLITSTQEHVTKAALSETSIKLVPPGAILLAMYGATVGRLAILGVEAATNQAVCHIVPNPDEADTRYLYYALSDQVPEIITMGVGGAQPNISQGLIKELRIPLPPLAEQRRIAAILDQADALRAKRRESLTQLNTLKQSIFLDMFGEPISNPKGWQFFSLSKVCNAINDCPHTTPIWTDSGTICLRTSNLTKGGWNWEDTRYVSEETYLSRSSRGVIEAGDLILSREGTVGVAAIIKKGMRVCMGQRLVQLRPNNEILIPEYLLQYLLHVLDPKRISRLMVGSTAQHLNVKELRGLDVPIPPMDQQQEYKKRILVLNKIREESSSAQFMLDQVFSSLQHRAFRGEL